jgi:hypothetical protein
MVGPPRDHRPREALGSPQRRRFGTLAGRALFELIGAAAIGSSER